MGRRTHQEVQTPAPEAEAARREFQHLRRLLRAAEPGSLAEATSRKIMAEANRIEALELPPTEATAELRAFVRALGLERTGTTSATTTASPLPEGTR